MGIYKMLEVVQQNISGFLDDVRKSIKKVEIFGYEFCSVGGYLKNVGCVVVGREIQVVDGGQEGCFQVVFFVFMWIVYKMFFSMNNIIFVVIGNVE